MSMFASASERSGKLAHKRRVAARTRRANHLVETLESRLLLSLTVNYDTSAMDLANNILGGSGGITITNVTLTGSATSSGTFTDDTNSIGFPSGIVLSNGDAKLVEGPNNSSSATGVNNLPGDPDLNKLIDSTNGDQTYDATTLTITFVPSYSGQATFKYVFGSEEYNTFVGSFNDVFGFFLNGDNIALLPGTTTPVSINNINNGNPLNSYPPTNSQYYIDNTDGHLQTQLNGLTKVLVAKGNVIGGQENTIKLAIADANDMVLDSDVFIKSGSLVLISDVTAVNTNLNIGQPFTAPTAVFRTDAESPTESISAQVDWGDGQGYQPAELRDMGNNILGVVGSHVYTKTGTYKVLTNVNGTVATSTVNVSVAPRLLFTNNQSGTPNEGFQSAALGAFEDCNASANITDYQVIVNWGDGWVDSTADSTNRLAISELSRNLQQGTIWAINATHYYTRQMFDATGQATGATLPNNFQGSIQVIDASTNQTVVTKAFNVSLTGDVTPMLSLPNAGAPNVVQVVNQSDGRSLYNLAVVGNDYTGQVSTHLADITGDGVNDIIISLSNPGDAGFYVFNGVSGAMVADVHEAFAGIRGTGGNVAVGDVNGDGVPDVIVGTGPGTVGRIRVFDGVALRSNSQNVLSDLAVYGSGFTGGVAVAALKANATADANLVRYDVVVAPMSQASDTILPKVIDPYTGVQQNNFSINSLSGDVNLSVPALNYQVFGPTATGYTLATGDVNSDGRTDIILGQASGGTQIVALTGPNATQLLSFSAFGAGFTNGLTNLQAYDYNHDGSIDIYATTVQNGVLQTKIFDGIALLAANPQTLYSYPA